MKCIGFSQVGADGESGRSGWGSQVGNTGWTGMRAYHDQALIDEFLRRSIDVSAVYDGKTISFARPVKFNNEDNRLIAVG